MKGIIYKATNTYNGKVYIGQTVAGLSKRKAQHYRDARADERNAFHLALYQYPQGFTWEILDEFSGSKEQVIHALNVAEEYHILKLESTNPDKGYNATGGGYSSGKFAEYVKRAASARYGKTRPVLQYDKNGTFLRMFDSVLDAVKETRCGRKTILGYCMMDKVVIPPNCRTNYVWRFASGNYVPNKIEVIDLRPQKERRIRWKYNPDGSKSPVEIIESKNPSSYKQKMEHRIIQYTLDGEFVKVWDNAHQAAESGADSAAIIRKSLFGNEIKKTPNYQWRNYHDGFPKNIGRYNPGNAAQTERQEDTIEEVAWDGTIIATYKDTAEAAEKSGYSQSYICNVLAGRIRHPKRKFRRKIVKNAARE